MTRGKASRAASIPGPIAEQGARVRRLGRPWRIRGARAAMAGPPLEERALGGALGGGAGSWGALWGRCGLSGGRCGDGAKTGADSLERTPWIPLR